MTSIEGALADTSQLDAYCGHEVLSTKIKVTKAGDGLSEGMAIEPIQYPIGTKLYVVLECTVEAHKHKPVKGDPEALELEQILAAGTAAIVDKELVVQAVTLQREKLQEARDRARGVVKLQFDDGDEEEPSENGDGGEVVHLPEPEWSEDDEKAEPAKPAAKRTRKAAAKK